MAIPKRLSLMGDRVGAPFAVWRIAADHSVSGATLYTCNDTNSRITTRQAYTARGSWVCVDINAGEYFTDQGQALQTAHNRAVKASHAAHEAYIKASAQAREARDALNAFLAK